MSSTTNTLIAFNATASACNGIYPESKTGEFATCWYHSWESSTSRQHLWASTKIPGREVTRIFLSDVKSRIEHNGYASSTSTYCDPTLISFLTEAHERGIRVYALFAVSDAAFSETYMAEYPHQFNTACGTSMAYFDGVSINNEYFSSIKSCTAENEVAQLTFLTNLNTAATNAQPLPLHFSVSWNWDCCSCSSSSYETRTLTWNGETKSALAHMIDIADSVDVQVAYNVPSVMEGRADRPHQYWMDKVDKSSTSALYVLAYTNPNELCQLSFAPHASGSSTVTDTCAQGDRTEAGMFAAFDHIESALPGAIGSIHYMGGVFSTGMTSGWPKHDDISDTCSLNQRFNAKQNKCVNRCKRGKVWTWNRCRCTCPTKCKIMTTTFPKRCVSRCDKYHKWHIKKKRCIPKHKLAKGFIWDWLSQTCKRV